LAPVPNALPVRRVTSTRLDKPFSDPYPLGYVEPANPEELGSGFGWDRIFEAYNDGQVFLYEDYGKIKDYKDMLDMDGKAASVEKLLTYPILAAPWEIKPVSGDKGEAQFIREFFDASYENGGMKTPIGLILAQMNFAQTVGRAYFEKVPKVREQDGSQVFEKVAWRPPETCELALNARNTEVIGFRQHPTNRYGGPSMLPRQRVDKNGYIPIMGQRAFVYIHGTWRDPIDGYSAMKTSLWCHETKKKLRFLWYQFLEQTMLPKTIVKNADERQARADARKVATLRSRDVLGIGTETEIDTLESAGHGAAGYLDAIRWLDSEMSHSVLGGFMDLTSSAASGKGSFALSADQSTLFLRTRRFVARDMARQITSGIIAPIIRWNFGSDAAVPQFVFGPLSEANEEKVMDLFGQLATTTQAVGIPQEFMEQLTIRLSNILEIDPTRIQESFDKIKEDAGDDPVKMIAGQVALATQMVQEKQADAQVASTKEQIRASKASADVSGGNAPVMNDPAVPPPPKEDSGETK